MRTAMQILSVSSSRPLPVASLPALAAVAALLCMGCGRRDSRTAYHYGYEGCDIERGYAAEGEAAAPDGYNIPEGYKRAPVRYSHEHGGYVATIPEGAQNVMIILPSGEAHPAPPPVPVAALPTPVNNPFEAVRAWRGKYVCPQGVTDMSFTITSVEGTHVEAVFSFNHRSSGAVGAYRMSGRFDPRTRSTNFEPGDWLLRPPGYITISMQGRVASDGSFFDGVIPHPGCSWFRLRPVR